MTPNIKYISITAVIIIIIGLGAFYMGRQTSVVNKNDTATITLNGENNSFATTTTASVSKSTTTTKTTATATTKTTTNLTSGNTAGFNSYNNTEYNFSIKYPSYVKMNNTFTTFHEIGNNWRLYASSANQGKPIISLPIYSIDQGSYSTGRQSYPLYFTSEVRVGVSPNISSCYAPDSQFPDQKITNVNINGILFKKFSSLETIKEKYTQSESYRIVRNNNCFVIEQIKSGTTFKDDTMKPGVSETTLNNYYNTGETIVKTFKFTK